MEKFLMKLKEQAEDNPVMVLGVGAAVVASAAKLIDAAGSVQSRRAYAKRMNPPKKSKK